MFALPWKYIIVASKSWGKAIAGPLFAGVGLLLIALQQTKTTADLVPKWGAWITLALAAVAIFIAQYRVWKQEYEARCTADTELSSQADMQGTIWVSVSDTNPNSDQTRAGSSLRYSCRCANHGRKTCQINRALIHIRPVGKQAGPFNVMDFLLPSSVKTVPHGEEFVYEGGAHIPHLMPPELKQAEISVYLIDSLDVEYRTITTRRWALSVETPAPARP
jgi:hypothetical protein